ncbi:MAG: LysR family transcriptional regulator [Proteobacteria bacterium]|nr:MAG: LysR family transcriptional regulator [Pseudomonadota bacterium]
MDKQWLNYHHLYYFTVIAHEGAIAKAAKKLRLGQPTLSTQLKQFEDHLGFALFERTKKRLHLTEAGQVALDYANEIFRLGSEMMDTLNDNRRSDRHEIQIGCMDSIPKDYVLKLIQSAQTFRSCHVSCIEGSSDHLLEELKAHRLDLLLTNHPLTQSKQQGLFSRRVGQAPVHLYGDKKFQKLAKGFPASLNGQPFILSNHNISLRRSIEFYLKSNNVTIDVVAEVQDTSLQRLMCVHGLGIVPLADTTNHSVGASKELLPIGALPGIFEEVWIIVADRRLQNPVADHLLKEFHL